MTSIKKYNILLPCGFACLQILCLFLLRKLFLLTVYQTVATYAAVCLIGTGLALAAAFLPEKGKLSWRVLSDSYLVIWSGVHSVIVLGFLTCGTFYLTLTQITIIQIVNFFLGIALYWFLYVLTGKVMTALGLGNLLVAILGTANYYLTKFRGAPLQLNDLRSAGTAANVVQNYDFTPDILLVASLADLLLWYVLWKAAFSGKPKKTKRLHPVTLAVTFAMLGGCIALPVMKYDKIYADTTQFSQDTYLADLLAQAMGSMQSLPEEYSIEEVERIAAGQSGNGQQPDPALDYDATQLPNIVVIMNEAFSDLRVLGTFETTLPVMENWDSLQENTVRGWANVSVLGGNTANSEYEFLSSDSMGVYNAVVPYNSFFSSGDVYPGLTLQLKELGYRTTAFHPYLSSGWNRTQVYRAMQFDNILFLEDVAEELDKLRLYVSDKGDYSYIRSFFEEKEPGEPQFFFNVTMQNHGGYTYSGENFQTTVQLAGELQGKYPQTEQYLSLMRESDLALAELLAYFKTYEEPVAVVLFGDHQPKLEYGFYQDVTGQSPETWSLEQRMKQYKTPFIIWHNYDTESAELGNISLNYLAGILLEDLGLPTTAYQQYVKEQSALTPVINSLGSQSADGSLYAKGSPEFTEAVRDFKILIYNHTVDQENRIGHFFHLNLE